MSTKTKSFGISEEFFNHYIATGIQAADETHSWHLFEKEAILLDLRKGEVDPTYVNMQAVGLLAIFSPDLARAIMESMRIFDLTFLIGFYTPQGEYVGVLSVNRNKPDDVAHYKEFDAALEM